MDGSLVIMEGNQLSVFLLLQWMVAMSLSEVVSCRDFCYSNGWLVVMKGSLFSISLLLQWMVAWSLWKVVCVRDFSYSNGG